MSVRYGVLMMEGTVTTVTATEARKLLYKLLDDVSESHEPIQITGKRGSAILVSVPGMRESILDGMKASVGEYDDELDW